MQEWLRSCYVDLRRSKLGEFSLLASKHSKSSKESTSRRESLQFLQRPQRPPKGLLPFYILNLISEGSTHGFEILQSIEEKTGGSWRPGAGSIYATLRNLTEEGFISTNSKPRNSSQSSQRVYQITPKGVEFLREGKDMLANADRNWYAMRGIFIDLMDATRLPVFLGEGSKANFQLSREIIQAKMPKLDQKEAESALKEYALNLGKQMAWTEARIQELKDAKVRPQDTRTGLPSLRAVTLQNYDKGKSKKG